MGRRRIPRRRRAGWRRKCGTKREMSRPDLASGPLLTHAELPRFDVARPIGDHGSARCSSNQRGARAARFASREPTRSSCPARSTTTSVVWSRPASAMRRACATGILASSAPWTMRTAARVTVFAASGLASSGSKPPLFGRARERLVDVERGELHRQVAQDYVAERRERRDRDERPHPLVVGCPRDRSRRAVRKSEDADLTGDPSLSRERVRDGGEIARLLHAVREDVAARTPVAARVDEDGAIPVCHERRGQVAHRLLRVADSVKEEDRPPRRRRTDDSNRQRRRRRPHRDELLAAARLGRGRLPYVRRGHDRGGTELLGRLDPDDDRERRRSEPGGESEVTAGFRGGVARAVPV